MRRRPRILLDVDGPLTLGFVAATCQVLRDLGYPADADTLHEWDLMKAYGVSADDERYAYQLLGEPGLALHFDARDGAAKFVEDLKQRDYDVYAVTAPLSSSRTWAADRIDWLGKTVGIDRKHVVSTDDKVPVAGDVLLDDKPSNVQHWQAEYPHGLAILWREAYNTSTPWGATARDYDEALYTIDNFIRRPR